MSGYHERCRFGIESLEPRRTLTRAAGPALERVSDEPGVPAMFSGNAADHVWIFGPDDRTLVGDTLTFPRSAIGRVSVRYSVNNEDKWFSGTGALVGPRQVLTAGHMLYSSEYNKWADAVYFSPGQTGALIADPGGIAGRSDRQPFGMARGTQLMSVDGWTVSHNYDDDYGLLYLDRDIGNFTGWFGYASNPNDNAYIGATMLTAGYPGDLNAPDRADMYEEQGLITSVEPHQLRSNQIDVAGGQSGSPVWTVDGDGQQRIRGVVSYGTTASVGNGFVRIDQGAFDKIKAWIAVAPTVVNLPDLVPADDWSATSIESFGPAAVTAGGTLALVAPLRNVGTAAAQSFRVDVFADDGSARWLLSSMTVDSISPLTTTTLSFSITVPETLATGAYKVRYSIAAPATGEYRYDNNDGEFPGWLTVLPQANREPRADVPAGPAAVGDFYGDRGDFVGDVNGDGRVDLIAWNSGAKWVALASPVGDGFDTPRPWGTSNDPFFGSITDAVADVNGDGFADLVAWNRDSVFVMVGSATGFSRPTLFGSGLFFGQRGNYLADVNGDRLVDLLAWNDGAKWVALARPTKDGFEAPRPWGTSNDAFFGSLSDSVADVNGDGLADLVAWNRDSVFVMVGSATGFSRPTLFKAGLFFGDRGNFLADLNGDRKADLVAWNQSSKFVALARQNGTGFMDPLLLQNALFDASRARMFGDVDKDGDDDLIAWNNDSVFVSRVRPRNA